jgi:pyrimidine-specific ribonucleoside hydrolase
MKNYKSLNVVILVFFLFSFSPSLSAAGRQALIIDTDVGRDDIIAMMYLAKAPRVKIKAITIESNGDAHCVPAFHNTAGLLRLLGLNDVPMACGSEGLAVGGHIFPQPILVKEDSLSGAAAFLPVVNGPVRHDAVALLVKNLLASFD